MPSEAPFYSFGIHTGSDHFSAPAHAHRHNEIELIFVRGGGMTFVFGGKRLRLEQGQCAAFWAVVPHLAYQCDEPTMLYWMKVPLQHFLEWRLPEEFARMLLRGRFLLDPNPLPEAVSIAQFEDWSARLAHDTLEDRKIVLLEVEARLRKLAMNVLEDRPAPSSPAHAHREHSEVSHADLMMRHIATHYQEPLTVADVAAAANLQPGYAMRLFRAHFGASIVGYLHEHRIAHAQRMLVTTDATVLDILLDAGFNSVTQFYEIFKRSCGTTPVQYRNAMQL
ncbi:AraC family transcriptional regulator [Capsulimonas corticalis]|uniref:AraC family transcriptional regulator n=1 Tax=Capsulimonas corticalis TaxID=2219043 RepID=A0A402CNL2_9BACT|nr:AraC family transcriptional regulator [Capsulimonas corticalis]